MATNTLNSSKLFNKIVKQIPISFDTRIFELIIICIGHNGNRLKVHQQLSIGVKSSMGEIFVVKPDTSPVYLIPMACYLS